MNLPKIVDPNGYKQSNISYITYSLNNISVNTAIN